MTVSGQGTVLSLQIAVVMEPANVSWKPMQIEVEGKHSKRLWDRCLPGVVWSAWLLQSLYCDEVFTQLCLSILRGFSPLLHRFRLKVSHSIYLFIYAFMHLLQRNKIISHFERSLSKVRF